MSYKRKSDMTLEQRLKSPIKQRTERICVSPRVHLESNVKGIWSLFFTIDIHNKIQILKLNVNTKEISNLQRPLEAVALRSTAKKYQEFINYIKDFKII